MKAEDYVSREVAKLLKEKGYNSTKNLFFDEESEDWISQPSLAEAEQWLREEHSIFVTVFPAYDRAYEIIDYRVRLTEYSDLIDNKKGKLLPVWFEPYNQALNEGIKEALKLIDNETVD